MTKRARAAPRGAGTGRRRRASLEGQRFALLYSSINDTHSVVLQVLQGANVIDPFYWDRDEQTRAWSKHFFERRKALPAEDACRPASKSKSRLLK